MTSTSTCYKDQSVGLQLHKNGSCLKIFQNVFGAARHNFKKHKMRRNHAIQKRYLHKLEISHRYSLFTGSIALQRVSNSSRVGSKWCTKIFFSRGMLNEIVHSAHFEYFKNRNVHKRRVSESPTREKVIFRNMSRACGHACTGIAHTVRPSRGDNTENTVVQSEFGKSRL